MLRAVPGGQQVGRGLGTLHRDAGRLLLGRPCVMCSSAWDPFAPRHILSTWAPGCDRLSDLCQTQPGPAFPAVALGPSLGWFSLLGDMACLNRRHHSPSSRPRAAGRSVVLGPRPATPAERMRPPRRQRAVALGG